MVTMMQVRPQWYSWQILHLSEEQKWALFESQQPKADVVESEETEETLEDVVEEDVTEEDQVEGEEEPELV